MMGNPRRGGGGLGENYTNKACLALVLAALVALSAPLEAKAQQFDFNVDGALRGVYPPPGVSLIQGWADSIKTYYDDPGRYPEMSTRVTATYLGLHRDITYYAAVNDGNGSVVFFGESLTAGWTGPRLQVMRDMMPPDFGNNTILNWGLLGDTSEGLKWRLVNGALPSNFNPDVIIFSIGRNDLNRGWDDDTMIAQKIFAIAKYIHHVKPKAIIIITTILPDKCCDAYWQKYHRPPPPMRPPLPQPPSPQPPPPTRPPPPPRGPNKRPKPPMYKPPKPPSPPPPGPCRAPPGRLSPTGSIVPAPPASDPFLKFKAHARALDVNRIVQTMTTELNDPLVRFVDCSAFFLNEDNTFKTLRTFQGHEICPAFWRPTDWTHLSDLGYQKYAECLAQPIYDAWKDAAAAKRRNTARRSPPPPKSRRRPSPLPPQIWRLRGPPPPPPSHRSRSPGTRSGLEW